MNHRKIAFVLFLVFLKNLVVAQEISAEMIDSLKTKLAQTKADTNRVHLLENLMQAYYFSDEYDSALRCASDQLALAKALGFKPGIASAANNCGQVYYIKGNYPAATQYHLLSLKTNEEIGNKRGLASSYNNLAIVFLDQENYAEALKYNKQSLAIKKEINDRRGMMNSYNNLGIVYYFLNDFAQAEQSHKVSLQLATDLKNKAGQARSYNNLGLVSLELKKTGEAEKYFRQGLEIANELQMDEIRANVYLNLGKISLLRKEFSTASALFNKCLSIAKPKLLLEAIKNAHLSLYTADSITGNWRSSLDHYRLYIAYRDSLINEDNSKKIVQQQMQYEFDKKQNEQKLLQDKKDALSLQQLQNQRTQRNYFIVGFSLVLLCFVFMARSFLQKKRANKMLEEKNLVIAMQKEQVEIKQKEILDSINYASRIQKSLLPTEKYIDSKLKKIK